MKSSNRQVIFLLAAIVLLSAVAYLLYTDAALSEWFGGADEPVPPVSDVPSTDSPSTDDPTDEPSVDIPTDVPSDVPPDDPGDEEPPADEPSEQEPQPWQALFS